MAHTRHIIEEADARHIAQCLTILDGYLMTSLDGGIDLLQIQQAVGSTHLIDLAVDARSHHFGFACETKVL